MNDRTGLSLDDQLEGLGVALRHSPNTVPPPVGDLPIGDPPRGRQLAVVSLVVVAAIVIALGVVVRNRGGNDQSVDVVSGPTVATAQALPPLAPEGIPWAIHNYDLTGLGTGAADESSYTVEFEYEDADWDLNVHTGHPSALGVPTTIDGRTVWAVGEEQLFPGHTLAEWETSPGVWAQLMTRRYMDASTGNTGATTSTAATTAVQDDVAAMVRRIQPVPDAEWRAALNPPPDATYPISGRWITPPSGPRPIHLGLDAPPEQTTLFVRPWALTQSAFTDPQLDAPFRLTTSSDPYPYGSIEDISDDVVTVRGVEGRVLSHTLDTTATTEPKGATTTVVNADGTVEYTPTVVSPLEASQTPLWTGVMDEKFTRSINWTEAGSTVQLQVPEGVSIEQAIGVADSLIVLDDPAWEALLFPGSSEVPTPPPAEMTRQPVQIRVDLPGTQFAVDSEIHGLVVVDNNTGAPIEVEDCASPFGAWIQSDTIDMPMMSPQCLRTFTLPEGQSSWPFTLRSIYSTCIPVESRDENPNSPETPDCLAGPSGTQPPPLPPGPYTVVVQGGQSSPALPEIDPIEISLE